MSRASPQTRPIDLSSCIEKMDRGRIITRSFRMEPNQAFEGYAGPLKDAIDLFGELGIGYVLAGGLAAMLYGRTRFTEDVDFVLVSGHETTLRNNPQAMSRHHFDPDCTYMLYHESGVEADIWKDEHSDAIVDRARIVEWQGRRVSVIDVHDLIAMKLRADRLKDHADIAEVLRETPVDESILRERVTPRQFRRFGYIKRRK